MRTSTDIPISLFELLPLEEHPTGTVLILPYWNASPTKICLGIKVSRVKVNQSEAVDAVLVIQGSPFGSEDLVGEVLANYDQVSRIFEAPIFGLRCPMRVDLGGQALVDQSTQTSWRHIRGGLVLTAAGVRVGGGGGEGHRVWGQAYDPATWAEDPKQASIVPSAVVREWSLILRATPELEVQIPVAARALLSQRG